MYLSSGGVLTCEVSFRTRQFGFAATSAVATLTDAYPREEDMITNRQVLAELDQRISFELGLLLKKAQPTRLRVHQLTKLIQNESQNIDFESTRRRVLSYFEIPFERRTSGQFQRTFGVQAYPWLHDQFLLNYTHAQISETSVVKLAVKIRHYLKITIAPPRDLIQADFLHLTVYKLVHPQSHQKKSGLRLYDFTLAWAELARKKWGSDYNLFFNRLVRDLRFEYGAPLSNPPLTMGTFEDKAGQALELTQTDLEWMKSIVEAASHNTIPLNYPLSRGPNQPATRQLDKLIRSRQRLPEGPKAALLMIAARNLSRAYLKIYGQD